MASLVPTSTPVNGSSSSRMLRLLCQSPRQEDALLLSTGQLPYGPLGQVGHAKSLQAGADDLPIGPRQLRQPAPASIAAHGHDVLHRDRETSSRPLLSAARRPPSRGARTEDGRG